MITDSESMKKNKGYIYVCVYKYKHSHIYIIKQNITKLSEIPDHH